MAFFCMVLHIFSILLFDDISVIVYAKSYSRESLRNWIILRKNGNGAS
jgi:hypothetical protein